MSQQNSQQLYPSLPPPYIYQQPQNAQSENPKGVPQQQVIFVQPSVNSTSPNQPLLPQQVVYYPVYHPQRMVRYARKSRRNCCCVCWSITCCCLLLVGIIIGATFGFLAWKCSQLDVSVSNSYDVDATNATRFTFDAQDGDYLFQQRTDGVNNVTVTVTRRTSDEDSLSSFNTSLTNSNGEVNFVDTSSFNSWWNIALFFCMKAQVTVLVPPGNVAFYVSNSNGDIVLNGTFSSNYTTFTATTVNGDIHIESISASSVTAGSTNGDVHLNNVVADDIQLSSTNGDITADSTSVSSTVKASTTNGEVKCQTVTCIGPCDNLSFTSTNGDVSVNMYQFSGNFDVQTTNGDAIVTGNNINYQENTSKHVVGSVNSGAGNLEVSTTNGDASVSLN